MTKETFLEKNYREYLELLKQESTEKLINRFNREVGCNGWTGTRSAYLAALRTAIDEKNLDLDQSVFMPHTTSYKRKIRVANGAIIPIE